ncbi:hypothetical protein H6G76_26895 [Nostoc sp. FACHB-152]|uniref:hypothetical protein n=1 Tax=unclassified Nostoc TaxID=2593658 RepID=UPI001686E635|nr:MULTISPECIES: hypothetical protein [unclassified Nostoc]MBD2450691.1 hypothetical protein [Nostoc sp. FACHB-152]MBD2471903.1 hypothetical protein [Nostoc sp. FACHB-145]
MKLSFDEWEHLYKGRFKELQQKIQVGIEAAERGAVLDAKDVFERLREKMILLEGEEAAEAVSSSVGMRTLE